MKTFLGKSIDIVNRGELKMKEMRTTNAHITYLSPNEVFVFGSNLSGRHGAGAARTALRWGAIYGNPCGLQGCTYAIPTVNAAVSNPLELGEIKKYVDTFIDFAKKHPDLIFLVTEIGCGLAGHVVEDIAPLFVGAINVSNIHLPERFWNLILS